MYLWWRALICTYLLSPKVSSKFYAVYPINIGVKSHYVGQQKNIAIEGLVARIYLFKTKGIKYKLLEGAGAVKI